nr:hypothetical protein [Tanacetum cinerariifolium]
MSLSISLSFDVSSSSVTIEGILSVVIRMILRMVDWLLLINKCKPIYDEEPMAEVQTNAKIDVFAIGQQHTEQPEFNNEGEVVQNAEECHDTCPLHAILTDNQIQEHSYQSLESENMAKLLKENKTLKTHYKELFDSIKITRVKTTEQTTSLIATNDKFKAQLQEKGFAIAALKNELRKSTGNKVNIDNPNITMEEYIRLEEEKARRRAIVFNDTLTSKAALSCEPTLSSLNDEIDFRVSFDESDDEDYTVVFEKKTHFLIKNSTNDLKMDLKNDNYKVNMPLLPSPEPADTDNDNDKIDIEKSSKDMSVKPLPDDMSYHHHSSVSSAEHFNVSRDMLLIPTFLIKKLNLSRGKGLVKMSASCEHRCAWLVSVEHFHSISNRSFRACRVKSAGSTAPLEKCCEIRKLDNMSYHARGACLRLKRAFFSLYTCDGLS